MNHRGGTRGSSPASSEVLTDALGSVRGLADGAGSLTGSRSYEAFGAARTSTGGSSLFGFAGEPADATGLVYLRARSLDPATGRFLSADSVIPNAPGSQGYSLYAYVANNPATWTDPTGHSSTELTGTSGIALAAALGLEAAALVLSPAVIFWVAVIAIILFLIVWFLSNQGALGQGSSVLPRTQEECAASGNVQTAVDACPETAEVEEPAPKPRPTIPPILGDQDEEDCAANTTPERLPDDAWVVRGGQNTPEIIADRSECIEDDGTIVGLSVNSAPGVSIQELARPEYDVPHKQIGVTTVGQIRAIGGEVDRAQLPHNPYHALVSGITPQQLNALLTPTEPNPNFP